MFFYGQQKKTKVLTWSLSGGAGGNRTLVHEDLIYIVYKHSRFEIVLKDIYPINQQTGRSLPSTIKLTHLRR